MHELITAWRSVRLTHPPFLLPGDEALRSREGLSVVIDSWARFAWSEHVAERDSRFHLGLLPKPFSGNLPSASVVILALNPGLNPVDYFGEYRVPAFRRALVANLRQRPQPSGFPNPSFNPGFSWHSGFKYWNGKLRNIISRLSRHRAISPVEALRLVSRRVAFLQLYPYHSASFRLPPRVACQLQSPQLARSFAHEVLLPKACAGRALIVVLRQASAWGLPPGRGVIVYGRGESRGAHLTPESRGGRAILRHLLRAG